MATPKLAAVESLKVPPHSLEAEQAVLGGLMLSTRAFEQVADLIVESELIHETRASAALHADT